MSAKGSAAVALAIKTAGAAAAFYLAVFYLRLGLILPLPFLVFMLALLAGTARERSALGARWLIAIATSVLFAFACLATIRLATTTAPETFDMNVTEAQQRNDVLALRFARNPSHFELVTSAELRRRLSMPAPSVVATLEVTRELGCVRGVSLLRIEGIHDWRWLGGGLEAGDDPDGPWPKGWWCP